MPDITIDQTTFERLQSHAKPLVDTTDTVINRALDALDVIENDCGKEEVSDVTKDCVDPRALPNLAHTKVLEALISGQAVVMPNWNKLFVKLLVLATRQVDNFFQLRKLCQANMMQGCKVDEGYRHVTEIDISVQYMSATDACEAIVAIAQGLNIGIEINFMWNHKKGALHPGEERCLCLPD